MSKLKPCPFCGSNRVTLEDDDNHRWVICRECWSRGKVCDYSAGAESAWNRRAFESEQTEAQRDLEVLRQGIGDDQPITRMPHFFGQTLIRTVIRLAEKVGLS